MNLDNLPLLKKAVIKNINCNKILKQRLYDLGVVEGEVVIVIRKAPFGGPFQIKIAKTTLLISKKICKFIEVLY